MKTSQVFILLLGLCLNSLAYGETIFIQYDKNCMDRYEYRYNGGGYSHIAYHLNLDERQKVILEVGIESKVPRNTPPQGMVNCANVKINERTIREINNGETQVYIVRRQGNQYNVSPVGIATYSQISPTFIGFTSLDYKFVYNFRQPASQRNLADSKSESSVFFRGTLKHHCPKQYQFEKTKKQAGRNYSEMVIIPEIGIIEERSGFNKTDAANNRLVLVAINGTPIEQFYNNFCSEKGLNNVFSGTFYSDSRPVSSTSTAGGGLFDLETGTYKPDNNNNTNTGPNTNNSTGGSTTGTTTRPDGSTVFTGTSTICPIYKDLDRNIYIDRTTGQPAEGECGGNTYRNGQMVNGSSVTTTTTTAGPTTTTTTTQPTTTPPTAPSTTVVSNGRCPEFSGDGYHIVQPNETLYGISKLYGLNVGQLKNFNGLRNDLIKPCMKLYTRRRGTTGAGNTAIASADEFTGKGNTHVVQKNETLYQLANRYGYTIDRFLQMNGLNRNDRIYVGQELKTSDCNCPAPSNSYTSVNAPATMPQPAEFSGSLTTNSDVPQSYDYVGNKRRVHIVKDNETVFSIARNYNMSVDRLRDLNNIEQNEIIIPYQRLYID
ncbi:MAG: LysM peptidoglycan-binding domain-containing protein [Bacteroidota bacterium]